MNYEEEMRIREKILSRIHQGEKVDSEERLWLSTHRIYNWLLGYPYLNTDIINLCPETNYIIRVKVESLTYPDRIISTITVPGGRGEIVANIFITNYNGKVASKKGVKMLGLLLDLNHNETEFVYRSDLGLLGISYECDYFDDKQCLKIRKNSNVGDPSFAMKREVLADNKIRYLCKNPSNNDYESFVFSVEWNKTQEHKGTISVKTPR